MVIGIIGASVAGLVAGEKLAKAGHNVTIIEKSRLLGGRLASRRINGLTMDYGLSHFTVKSKEFGAFVDEMKGKGMVKEWAKEFSLYDGSALHKNNPNRDPDTYYTGTDGMQKIAEGFKRWVDIKSEEKAGGLTYIGPDRTWKRSWMINLTDISVFECDAVIIATPAPEAYGVLQTSQDETPVRRIIRHIDEVHYKASFSLLATYNHNIPNWKGIDCEKSYIEWIGNESSKRNDAETCGLLIRSTHDFYRKHVNADKEEIKSLLLEEAADIAGPWIRQAEETYLHDRKYGEAIEPINEYFMELEMEGAPLSLIGDYFRGTSLEDAYISGYNLAEYWINKYSSEVAV